MDVPDQTLEILMSDLDVQAMACFFKSETVQTFKDATEVILSYFQSHIKDFGHLFHLS